ncbi:MAG: TVP38/TMEM64 family protein [Aquabacterium sp.]
MKSGRGKAATRMLLGTMVVLSIVAYFALRLDRFLTVESFKQHLGTATAWRDADPLSFGLLYFLAFMLLAGISFPGAVMLSMPAGTLFGLFWGTVIVSFASSLGAWLAFLSARYVFREPVERMLGSRMQGVHNSVARDGRYYLFTMRMAPVIPYFVVNLMMGLTPMSAAEFYWVSQLGMLAGTVLIVYAGVQIAHIHTFMDLFTPQMCAAVLLLAACPWLTRRAMLMWRGAPDGPLKHRLPPTPPASGDTLGLRCAFSAPRISRIPRHRTKPP